MKKYIKNNIVVFSIVIAIFTIGLVNKTFQNDTFFNISIGDQVLQNGIDMKEHFCWVDDNLEYTYSHWAFDILMYKLYSTFGFAGIYIFTIIFSVLTSVTLYVLLAKRTKSPFVAMLVALLTTYMACGAYAARAQIISFICFIIEIYCIERFIETNKKRYAITIIGLAIIIANFHAATWPLVLVLFMPYLGAAFINFVSVKNLSQKYIKYLQKKKEKLPKDSPKIAEYEKDIEYYEKIASSKNEMFEYKFVKKEDYNTRNLVILILIVLFTGLISPSNSTPYTYILKSMFGQSNFEGYASIDFINEMKPAILATNVTLMISLIFFIVLFLLPTKIKLEHIFLIGGLMLMGIMSNRYAFLLAFLGSFVLGDLLFQLFNIATENKMDLLEDILSHWFIYIGLVVIIGIFSYNNTIEQLGKEYVDSMKYPVGATKFIKENIDYKNMRIYNSYNVGSYLMLNDIPVFIDSRLDVYCSEFNDTDIFYDYIQVSDGLKHYDDVFEKYDFTHILLEKDEPAELYIKYDEDYKEIYSDKVFVLYEKIN